MSTRTGQQGKPSGGLLLRDWLQFLGGWTIIFLQLLGPPDRVNIAFLVLAGGLVGAPVTLGAIAQIRGAGTGGVATPSRRSRSSSSSGSSSSGGER